MRPLIKNLSLLALVFGALIFLTEAFAPPSTGDKYHYGSRSAVTLISADTVTIAPNNLTLTYATLSADTNIVFDVNVDNSIVGDRIVLEVTADATTRQMTFNSNVTALADSVEATKTKLFEFVYNGTNYKEVAEMAVD